MADYIKPAPLSEDEEAVRERQNCDYSVKIDLETARSGQATRKVRVYADGIFDLFHSGHVNYLQQAKTMFPNTYLIAGVCSDKETHPRKGLTATTDEERYNQVRQCRFVDEVLMDAPWKLTEADTTRHKIDFVVHDDLSYPTDGGENDLYGWLKKRGMFVATKRCGGMSTTALISSIIRRSDELIYRNLTRGMTTEELNITSMQSYWIRIKNSKSFKNITFGFECLGKAVTSLVR